MTLSNPDLKNLARRAKKAHRSYSNNDNNRAKQMSNPVRSYTPRDLHARSEAVLSLAAHGSFWVGIDNVSTPQGTFIAGQMYVEYWVPSQLLHEFPLVMIHGGGGQGLDYLQTADGRPGWVSWFVQRGYAVYVVDRPGHGRSPFHPELLGPMPPPQNCEFLADFFSAPAKGPTPWPQASLHTQWPGEGNLGDPALEAFAASSGPSPAMPLMHELMRKAGAELLDLIGPAVLLTHSAGGPCGWMIADERPQLIKAIVAVEPLGPPFVKRPNGSLDWGLTAAPLTFDPPVQNPAELKLEERAAPPGCITCLVQQEPARQLLNLQNYPIVVVTAQASWMAMDNHGTVDFLRQAGASVEHLRLEDAGITGNGHALMLEKNSDEIAELLDAWIGNHVND
ncbi:alpha/beta hydrolase [Pseudomonas silesiensis]|uniref:alpha/beta hydrolase n=1 Tax=Pseudomonas silesiensis TaxID=1853130 RepID=UPI0034D7B2F1